MGNDNVRKIIINDTIIFLKTAISISVFSNHNSFRVPFDKIASVGNILFEKIYLYFSIGNGQPMGNQHCANCIGTLSFTIGNSGRHLEAHCFIQGPEIVAHSDVGFFLRSANILTNLFRGLLI